MRKRCQGDMVVYKNIIVVFPIIGLNTVLSEITYNYTVFINTKQFIFLPEIDI